MAAYFTGREQFALTLAGAVLRSRVTVMYGQSGCGKSSVLGAAFPQVMAAILREPDEPVPRVSHRLLYFRRWHPGFETRLFSATAAKLNAPKVTSFAAAVAGWARDEEQRPPVVFVLDQFEEFLLYHPKPHETKFIEQLGAVIANSGIEARLLLSLREDSLASLDALRAVIPGVLSSPVQLHPLDRTAAEQAIRKPVARWSEECRRAVEIEPSLVDTLLDQVMQTRPRSPHSDAVANFVDLPLLQLSLERLWEEEAKAEKPVLQLRTLDQLEGAPGIVQRHLDQTLEALPTKQRTLAIRIFRHLVTATGGKQMWRADDLADEIDADRSAARQATIFRRRLAGGERTPIGSETTRAEVSETLNKLAQGEARILRTQPDPRGQGPLFELYHDALAEPVLAWVQEARIQEAVRRQRLWAAIIGGLVLFVVAGIVAFTSFKHGALIKQEQAQLQEARAVSILARRATQSGDAMTRMLAMLAVLPKDPEDERPISNAAASVLLDAWLHNHEKHDLLGHTDAIGSVAFSPDGRRVVTGSDDYTARVWDLAAPAPTPILLSGHQGPIRSAAFSPDGRQVVTGSQDGTARVWDVSTTPPQFVVLEGHRGPITSVAFSRDGRRVVTGSDDYTARIWDLATPAPTSILLAGHQGPIRSVAFSPDGRVVTGSIDGTARVWDLAAATSAANVLDDGHGLPVLQVAFSPDGRRVVTRSYDKTARVWDLSCAVPVAIPLEGHGDLILSVAFSPDGRRVATGSQDNTARVWGITGSDDNAAPVCELSGASPAANVTALEGHHAAVTSVAFSSGGQRVVTGSLDNTARVWDLSGTAETSIVLEGHTGPLREVAFSTDGRVVTESQDNTARVWDLQAASVVLERYSGPVSSVAFSSDGLVVTGSQDNTARVWNLSDATLTPVLLKYGGSGVLSAAFSPDRRKVVIGSSDHTARIWDLTTEPPAGVVLEGHVGGVLSVAFSPNGRRVITGSEDKTARVWDLADARHDATILEGHDDSITSVAFSPDGRRVVTGSIDRTARVWNLAAVTPVATVLKGHDGPVLSVAFSPDGRRVATASQDKTARVWDLSGATLSATLLEGHDGPITSVAFSPEGRRVVTGSEDNTAWVWDVSATPPSATVLEGHDGPVRGVAFSPDGRQVVTGSDDNTARVWDTPTIEMLIKQARAAVTRCLTITQRNDLALPVTSGLGKEHDHIDPPPCP
jgi:WD40 repeat protein